MERTGIQKKQPQPREIIKEEEKKGIRIAVRSKSRKMKYSVVFFNGMKYSQLQNNS